MAKTINSDLIRGNINTIILKALYDGDRYGYDIIREIELKSHGQYILKQPTLYSCLKRLESQGFIEAYWGEQTSNGGRRKYYRLTDAGKEIFKQSQDEYEYSRTVIDNLISDNQYDLSTLAPLVNTEKDEENLQEKAFEQISMDVSELEIAVSEKKEEENIPSAVENVENNTASTTAQTEYVEPAPVFSEVEEKPEYVEPAPTYCEKTETVVDTAQQSEEESKPEIEVINNSDYINSLLNQNKHSYFEREETEEIAQIATTVSTKYSQTTDDVEDIEKRLEALKASYSKEIEQIQEQENAQSYVPQSNLQTVFASKQTEPVKIAENYANGFYKYNTQHSGITTDEEIKTVHRSLSSLMQENTTTAPNPQEIKPKPVSIKEQIKIRNFGKLSESIVELGENVKLRPHYDTKHDYKKQYYYKDAYLRLYHFGILFLMLLVEVFATYIVGKLVFNANTGYDIPFYITSIVGCFLLPVVAVAIFISHPNSKKRNDYNLKTSIIFRILATIHLVLIIYALNIYMGMPITFDGKFFITLALPMVFVINFPISALIYNSLRKNKKFALNE